MIYEILAEKYVIGSQWKKSHQRGPTPEAGVLLRSGVTALDDFCFWEASRERSFIESFNRSVRTECLGWGKFRVEEMRERYDYHRPHLAFDPMRPPLSRDT